MRRFTAVLSAARTGSCRADEKLRLAVRGPHPAAAYARQDLLCSTAAERGLSFETDAELGPSLRP